MSDAAIGHALAEAHAAGWEVSVRDGRVRVRRVHGRAHSAGAASWRAVVRERAGDVARVLTGDVGAWVSGASARAREAWEERAAILEFDAGIERQRAERIAWCWRESGE